MKLIINPEVYIVGRQHLDPTEMYRFFENEEISWLPEGDCSDAEIIPEIAGRLCYMSFNKPRPGGNEKYLQHILEVGHGSVLEHTVFNFILSGISRALSHELVRHRIGVAISQLSQRYVDESVAEYVVPPEYLYAVQAYNSGNTSDSLLYNIGEEWMNSLEYAHRAYCRLVDLTTRKLQAEGLQSTELRKHARQAARSVLPNATETKIFWTANVRTIRHFLEQRGSISADKEIQSLALKLLKVCQKEAPHLFNDYEITEKGIETQFRKV